ncbi:hypothetical protein R1flu_015077 [Riccia fluitans]|uniref:Uncharacterized protein n=1 Tax=Riccia fluitans TaxID=41844 RepID=A0ABD1YHW8_9MARC
MMAEEGVTKAEGGVPEPEAGNMEGEEGVTEADGGVMEADLEEATEAEGGVTEPHLEEAADREGGVTEAEEVALEMEYWDFRNLVMLPTGWRVEHESQVTDVFHAGGDHETLSNTLAIGDVFVVKADDEEMEYWYFVFQKKLKGPKFIYVEAKKKDPAVIYSHLVRAVKIRMASMAPMGKQQDIARNSIANETHEQILAALSESEAPPFEKV